jgi:protein phosphatase
VNIVELAAITHTGQVRRSNEDSHLVEPPLFVLADGMGGARAGEVASRLCIEAFRSMGSEGEPEERLRRAIAAANNRIFEQAQSDPAVAGMGTTATAALVRDGSVSFGHVGDSRAYLYRDGGLQQISDDHSLVGELVRRGALSADEAEAHPQRSVITRAVGTEPDVEVDTWTIEGREGDVFLICSDGLSDMVGDDGLARILGERASLADTARELVRAANAAGGQDNTTALLFRLGDGPAAPAAAGAVTGADTTGSHATVLLEDRDDRGGGRSLLRRLALALVTVVAIAVLAGAATLGLRWAHFVGATADGRVAVYQGVPVDLGFGLRLYRRALVTPVPVAALSAGERAHLFDHALVSAGDARARVAKLPATAFFGS